MDIKKIVCGMAFFLPLTISAMPGEDIKKKTIPLKERINRIPDSIFIPVQQEDLLMDEVYIKLARDGWTPLEIRAIMDDYVRKNKKKVRGSLEYGRYAKQWLPSYGHMPGGDTLYQFIDTTYNEVMLRSARQAFSGDMDNYLKSDPYMPNDRLQGKRSPGIFRPVLPKPSGGRIHWIQVHPENPDSLMVIPDGGGINRTGDGGRTWDCITDRIPVREHRNTAIHSAIPVDPDDWNHVFAFMSNGNPVYETRDGGQTWRRIEGATHKGFKRGYCFRDKAGRLKFIGAVQKGALSYWGSELWISEDTCKTWTQVVLPEELKDIRPESGVKGAWFQQVEFDPFDRDRIYLPASRSIFYFDDGAKSYMENGKKVYKIKKMPLRVYAQDGAVVRSDTTVFPFLATTQSFLNVNPNNPDQMWFACASRGVSYGNYTALYYSRDKGKTWITLHEPSANIGSGRLFGNESPWGWLGGFGVNYRDTSWVYGCSMSSAISSNGGRNFNEFAWGTRMKSLQDDGHYYMVSNSRHNADNHCIVSHKSGRVFRGSDGGMLMKDLNINDHEWTNIGGNMGQMLFYAVKVNEFGDQLMLGNTQDIDVQTYRYGRWGNWRGYEGSTCFINPYGNTGYFSGGGTGLENIAFSSWNKGWTKADVCTGNWYLRREAAPSLYRIEDFGRTGIDLTQNVGEKVKSFALSRDSGQCTLFVLTQTNALKKSTDNGNSFVSVTKLNTNTALAADPEDSNIIYLGQKGKVLKYYISENRSEDLTSNLPAVDCTDLILHEGSGDLYFIHNGSGIYLKEAGADKWRYWTKGYNPAKFGMAEINYTTQEMVLCDYGRGVYVADLEHPSDRYFKDGFGLKEFSHVGDRRTLGIDTRWTIPLYYRYEWTVNGTKVENPYQYLTYPLRPGDRVQLRLTLRESPDVSTVSAEYTVQESPAIELQKQPGNALYSDGSGRVDLGYVDYFFGDFTLDLWVKPHGNGVLLCNRQKQVDRGAKGWYLAVVNGTLRFKYTPANQFNQPTYEGALIQQVELNAGSIQLNEWSHVAVTHERNGNITMYVNGEKRTQAARVLPAHTLNNGIYLSLFADGYEYEPIEGAVDELKIWNYALSHKDVHQVMFSHAAGNRNGLIYYNGFNGDELSADTELFTSQVPRIRTRAQVSVIPMPVAVGAEYAVCDSLSGRTLYASGGVNLMAVTPKDTSYSCEFTAYGYTNDVFAEKNTNLDRKYYTVAPMSYQFRTFHSFGSAGDTICLELYTDKVDPARKYFLFICESNSEAKNWRRYAELKYNETNKTLELPEVSASDLAGWRMIVVTQQPAIEAKVEGVNKDGQLPVYASGMTSFPISATVVGGLEEPAAPYQIHSDNNILHPAEAFTFVKGKAHTTLLIEADSLDRFESTKQVDLRGEDDRMIPFSVMVVNRVTPDTIGRSVFIQKGGFQIGNSNTYEAADLSNTLTMMGWVRIDSASVLAGLKPLIFFRGSGTATGIHLLDGSMRCHWNNESWSWNTATNLQITAADLGRWVHIALVARPDGMDYYLNGARYTVDRKVNPGRINSMLMLGQNNANDKSFSGAFDQVGVWNRSLSQDEIIKYMHQRVLMNDSALIVYQNMDYFDEKGNLREPKTGSFTMSIGTVTAGYRSTAPFRAVATYKSVTAAPDSSDRPLTLHFPKGKSQEYYVNTFAGYPYNYAMNGRAGEVPLSKTFYTFLYTGKTAFADTATLEIEYRHPAIVAGDRLTLALRPVGSEIPFKDFVSGVAADAGKVVFQTSAASIKAATECFVLLSPDAGRRPVKATLSLKQTLSGNHLVLKDEESTVPVHIRIESGNPGDVVLLTVKETEYASVARDTVRTEAGEDIIPIHIRKDKLDKLKTNPLTISLLGAETEVLALQVSLEPKVLLRLKNGTDESHFTATTPITSLEVEAEWLQGVPTNHVELTTIADVDHILNTGGGSLLSDQAVTMDSLAYYPSPVGPEEAGWNLVGNPYLTDIRLTIPQSVKYDAQTLAKFVYQYDEATANYIVSDLTYFDAAQSIAPFQPYWVQALTNGAGFQITPMTKDTVLTREATLRASAAERMNIRLELYTDSLLSDRTDIIWASAAQPAFTMNEDAAKWRSLSASANSLYSLAGQKAVAINTVPVTDAEIPLGMTAAKPGEYRLHVNRLSGFASTDQIILHDNQTDADWRLEPTSDYTFTVNQTGEIRNRFTIKMIRLSTLAEKETAVPVRIEGNTCVINNWSTRAKVVMVYNMQGRQIIRDNLSGNTWRVQLPAGSYLVKIRENEKEYTTKISIR